MNIFFIVDEFPFFLPQYLDKTISILSGNHTIVGITPLVSPPGHKTLYSYIIEHLDKLNVYTIMKLGFVYGKLILGKIAYRFKLTAAPYTIFQVAQKYNIPVIRTTNVNDPTYLQELKNLNIDIIVSSCSQIFKQEILDLPHIACINRHSALLPSYGGLFPVFQAMIHDERYVGATVHTMVRKIDAGNIITQKKYRVLMYDTLFSLYKKTYEISVDVTVRAILHPKKILHPRYKLSYYSFPTDTDWEIFWKKRKKII